MSTLEKRPNLGKALVKQLTEAEINSFEQLEEMGSEKTFLKLKTIYPDACINRLYAIEGAIQGIRWHQLSKDRKNELLIFFNMLK